MQDFRTGDRSALRTPIGILAAARLSCSERRGRYVTISGDQIGDCERLTNIDHVIDQLLATRPDASACKSGAGNPAPHHHDHGSHRDIGAGLFRDQGLGCRIVPSSLSPQRIVELCDIGKKPGLLAAAGRAVPHPGPLQPVCAARLRSEAPRWRVEAPGNDSPGRCRSKKFRGRSDERQRGVGHHREMLERRGAAATNAVRKRLNEARSGRPEVVRC